MVITFTDFIQNLASYHFVYTQDETAEMLQDSIHKLKETLPLPRTSVLDFFKKSTKIFRILPKNAKKSSVSET